MIGYICEKWVNLSHEIRFLREQLGKTIKLKVKIGIAAKKRLTALGVHCLEDLYGRSGDALDCALSGKKVNRRYLAAYRSAVEYAE